LVRWLRDALVQLIPQFAAEFLDDAFRKLTRAEGLSLEAQVT
jgi:hypothetical protein